MARLLLLNGLPASGKSTLASRYATSHPPTVALDIDELRGFIAGWSDRPAESGLQARTSAIAAASMHLRAGRDVIVPQYLVRLDFILELQRLATEVAASFVEIALVAEPSDAAERFRLRSDDPQSQTHRDAALLLSHDDTAAWSQMRDRLLQVLAARPGTVVIRSSVDQIDQTFAALERALQP